MPTTLQPPPDPRRLWPAADDHRTAGDSPAPAPAPRHRPRARRRTPLAVLVAVTALLGGGAGAGVLAATGALDGGATQTTTVVRSSSGATAASSDGGATATLDAAALFASASKGVVDITAKGTTTTAASPFGPPRESQSTATGTGFVVDGQGRIVTAAHVVDGATSITVRFADGTTRTAKLLGQDDATDVAVLDVDADGLTLHPLKLGSSASLDVGDAVAALGSPFGYEQSISTGIVSGADRTIDAPNGFTVAHAIQTDAAVNPGNSGGPLLNAAGEVTGIVDQIATDGSSEQSSGVGFAVPIDLVASELDRLIAGEDVEHAYLGVATSGATGDGGGATLADVTAGGPAAAAGLRDGDVVTRIGDTDIADAGDLVAAIADHRPGDEVEIVVERGVTSVERTVTLGTQPAQSTTTG